MKSKKHIKKKFKKMLKTLACIAGIGGAIASMLSYVEPKKETFNVDEKIQAQDKNNLKAQFLNEKASDLTYANVLYDQGREFFEQADYKKAKELYIEALEEHKENHYADMDTMKIQCALGNAYKYSGELDSAIDVYTAAIGTLKSVKELDTEWDEEKEITYISELTYIFYLRGTAYYEKNDLQLADEDCKKCFEYIKTGNVDNRLQIWENLSSFYMLAGKICLDSYYSPSSGLEYTLYDAYEAFNTALTCKGVETIRDREIADVKESDIVITKHVFGNYELVYEYEGEEYRLGKLNWLLTNPDEETATILTNRSFVEQQWGWYDEAIEDNEAALKIYESLPVSKRYNISSTYYYLSLAKEFESADEQGVVEESILNEGYDLVKKGLDYNKKWYGDTRRTAISYGHVGAACLVLNRYSESIEYFKEAKRIFIDLELESSAGDMQEFIEAVEYLQEIGGENGQWTLHKNM